MNNISKERWVKSFTTLDISIDKLPTERGLGMLWDTEFDNFRFDIQIKNKPRTRRGVLSTLSNVYDPFGYVSPFILKARRLFQQLCRLKTGWDDSLPKDLEEQWGRWMRDLPIIKEFSIARCIIPIDKCVRLFQLHHFCNASEYGYGAVSYLHTIYEDQTASVHLMMAKSRLAPLKGSTIPHLELAEAREAVRLDKLLQEEMEMPLEESVYWTDSTIVLWYLQSSGKRFQTSVSNRVAKILEHTTPTQWRHVPTSENPGDDASRRMSAEELVSDERRCKGPRFLYSDRSSWPRQPSFNCTELERMAEMKPPLYSECHESYQKGPLVADELRIAEEAIVRQSQKQLFDEKTQLSKLNPKKSASGLLLVGGRLTNSKPEDCTKHQLILPCEHPVSKLIIENIHQKTGHAGVERVLADIRRRYWILKGRKLVKIVYQSITCRNLRGKTEVQQMASLPESRVTPFEPPFTRIRLDYFGPFIVKRARSEVKRFGCIFTCHSIRAVHIEVANSLDTDSFINALERFIARRGKPKEIWSDNGTNFVGAHLELRRDSGTPDP
nr:uncharacterized protein LOC113809933 [Penaeus vannamei]